MKVIVDGVEYRIWFRYTQKCSTLEYTTQANIEEIDSMGYPTMRYVATSRCSPKDTFSKKIGRKIALGRALRLFKYGTFQRNDKEFRKQVWEQLFKGGLKK